MKRSLLLSLLLVVPWLLHAQERKTEVIPGGGGHASQGAYVNFGTFAQPFSGVATAGMYSNREGFIPAQQNRPVVTITGTQTLCVGTPALALTSHYNGAEGTIGYQWQVLSGSTWQNIPAATDITYDPGTPVATSQYRLIANDRSACGEVASPPVTITIDPASEGGTVTGDTLVCYGTNNTLLTLTGYTGDVLLWQYSLNNIAWTDLPEDTLDTYTAINLTANRWFRAVVKNGLCDPDTSASIKLTMAGYRISGFAKYYNNPETPLNGLKIFLRQGTQVVDSVVTSALGYFEFNNRYNSTYGLVIKSAHPSGKWQTWGGVNMSDYLLAYQHVYLSKPLPLTPPVVRISGDVKQPANPPVINALDATAIQYAAKYGWGPPYFDIPKWVFSGYTTETRIDTFTVSCAAVARNILGLCAGDINGTYLPSNGNKMAGPGLELMQRGSVRIAREMLFPVTVESAAAGSSNMGALTLLLNFDPARIEITGVEMADNGGMDPWFVIEPSTGELSSDKAVVRIGWFSPAAAVLSPGKTLLWIRARLIGSPDEVRMSVGERGTGFTLNADPLSELADENGQALENVILSMPVAKAKTANDEMINLYPNPVSEILNIEFVAEKETGFDAVLMSMQGTQLLKVARANNPAGFNKVPVNISDIPMGTYLIRISFGDHSVIRKIIVNR